MTDPASIVRANLKRLLAADGRCHMDIARSAFGAKWADAGRTQLRRACESGSLGHELAAALMAAWGIKLTEFYQEIDPGTDPGTATAAAEDARIRRARRRVCDHAISRLEASADTRLALIIRRRLDGWTHQEIGDDLGISRERVRQLESEAHQIVRRG